jgi:hypothetical protein
MIIVESYLNATLGHFVFGLKVVENNFKEKISITDSLKRCPPGIFLHKTFKHLFI